MSDSRTKVGVAVFAFSMLIGSQGALAQRAQLPEECRPPLRLCAGADNRQACRRAAMQSLPDTCRKAISDVQAARAAPLGAAFRELAYGEDARQKMDLAVPAGGKAPILLFVHGGGWSIGDKRSGAGVKGEHFLGLGWAFASAIYRLVPAATVEEQAADIASAVAFLRRQPGVDPNRIVLMGHSAGAHLVALVGTDPAYLRSAGVPMSAVRGVVLLDGAGYDVARQMAEPRNQAARMYEQAFSKDPKRQAALSPMRHAAALNAASWLILPVAHRRDSTIQSEQFAVALRAGGSSAIVSPQAGKTHATLNKELGSVGDAATVEVDAFISSLR